MAVRVLITAPIYYSPNSHMVDLAQGQVIDGDFGAWLLLNYPKGVEEIDAPSIVGESGPELLVPPGDSVVVPPSEPPPAPVVKPAPDPDPDPLVGADGPSSGSADDDPAPFEPADHNGPDVIAYAKANPDQRLAILRAERAGKARTTVLTALSAD